MENFPGSEYLDDNHIGIHIAWRTVDLAVLVWHMWSES